MTASASQHRRCRFGLDAVVLAAAQRALVTHGCQSDWRARYTSASDETGRHPWQYGYTLNDLARLGARLIIQRAVKDEFEAWSSMLRWVSIWFGW
jgi:hypothetical protein